MTSPLGASVVLTGATGFLGQRLCARLLHDTPVQVCCIVRSDTPAAATDRLHQALDTLGTTPPTGARLTALPGDLDRPRLGLEIDAWDRLAAAADSIFHCAASINLAADYDTIARTNVEGTRTMLALARHRTALGLPSPRIHLTSTFAVFLRAPHTGLFDIDEDSVATSETAGLSGYFQSKADVEILARTARQAGHDIVLHRPAAITGDWATGVTSPAADILARFLPAAIRLGHYPARGFRAPMETADTVAHGMLATALHGTRTTYHYGRDTDLREMFAALRRAGHPITPVPRDHWHRRVQGMADDPAVRPAAAFLNLAHGPGTPVLPRFHSEATRKALRAAAVVQPPLDDAYFDRWIAALTARQLLPPPPRAC